MPCNDKQSFQAILTCCKCEPVVSTMVRARLWPASPHRPQLAFTFELLDWAEALLLECQVSLMDFCKALCFKCPHLVVKRKGYYSSMIDAFEEYRCMKVEIRNSSFISSIPYGNICPACPKVIVIVEYPNRYESLQESGTLVLSMDALFGLPRKKSSGTSYGEAVHGHYFFDNQSAVDEFVSTVPKRKSEKV
jgi:hypothetical protein